MLSLQVRKLRDLYKNSSNTMASFTLSKKKLSKSLSTSALRTNSVSTSTIVFDIETNALKINDITTIHCCAINAGEETKLYKDPKEWLPILEEADVLVGHNIIQYDLVCIKHLYPEFNPKGHAVDTLILSRMFYPDILDIDYKHKWKNMPIQLYGRHKLEAYAHRLGMQKEHADLEDFSQLTEELAQRCISDVDVTAKLWSRLQPKAKVVPSAVDLEMRFAKLISKQEQSGFHFDCKGAMELEAEIATQLKNIDESLRQRFPFVDGGLFTPKRNDSSRGYVAQATMCRLVPLNPNSRDHIAWVLKNHLKWKAETFTETGKPKIDESVLKDVPGAELFLTSLTLQKRLGQLSTGTNAWLRLVQSDNRIHGSVITVGCATMRCAHVSPNVAQAVAVRSTLGKEMRSLFGPNVLSTYTSPKGMVSKGGVSCPKQVGVDLSGIEARCLAHYLWPFDGGSFAKEVIEGDIHTANQMAAGLPTRDSAKTFFYALIYGVGAEKLSKITGMNGKKLKQTYYKNMPALAALTKKVTSKADSEGILKALDGRPIKIRSPHSALNFLLQSAGAILSKAWYNICYDDITKEGWVYGKDWTFLAHIHDEIQFSVKEKYAQQLADIAMAASKKAGNQFKMRIDVESEYKIGNNWAECH
jgi:DNA polymerase I-like protein with 3'-5' exonuclease and polymerase domains